jgi:membrane protease YdiL (CAAX protease family)
MTLKAIKIPSPRTWAALIVLVAGYYTTPPITSALYHLLAHPLHLHGSGPNTLGEGTFGISMVASLIWNIALFVAVCLTLGQSPSAFPIADTRWLRHSALGLATGLAVMLGAILAIWGAQCASVEPSNQGFASLIRNGSTWLVLDYLGAAGEELFARATLLLVSQRFLGWRGAVGLSGVVFMAEHLGNPGASWVWLLRLFLQGMLLAYAVYRTRSLWWSIAYHAGWNWVSAPLFGAAGSGYLDEGHALDFFPHGPTWVTGGSVGPEGSLFAFIAVLAAFCILRATTKSEPQGFGAPIVSKAAT